MRYYKQKKRGIPTESGRSAPVSMQDGSETFSKKNTKSFEKMDFFFFRKKKIKKKKKKSQGKKIREGKLKRYIMIRNHMYYRKQPF